MQPGTDNAELDLHEPIQLKVIDLNGKTLVSINKARRSDFVVSAEFPGGRSALNLFVHYEQWFALDPDAPYIARDALCKTHEKFGHVIQDRLEIVVKITRAAPTSD